VRKSERLDAPPQYVENNLDIFRKITHCSHIRQF
jgi:hypothetical protein